MVGVTTEQVAPSNGACPITVEHVNVNPLAPSAASSLDQPHPQTTEIIRQIEYYFGDENLRRDAHLLALAGGDGNGFVSVNEILSWKKMRAFKPRSAVKAAMKLSSRVVMSDDNKKIKRKDPLSLHPYVKPEVLPERLNPVPEDKPWLTKNMMKPTGFEKDASDGPLTPAEYSQDLERYAPDVSISSRIEDATNRFLRKKRMHQNLRAVYVKFMNFGGIDCRSNEYGSGVNQQVLKQDDADEYEIERLTAQFEINSTVLLEFKDDDPDNGPWVIDFSGMAKAFLSSKFPLLWMPCPDEHVMMACSVLRKYYNYFLYHSVCVEYTEDIYQARAICDLAERELMALPRIRRHLPGNFNVACSTIFGGAMAGLYRSPDAQWHDVDNDDNLGMPLSEAFTTFAAGICLFGSDDQIDAVAKDQVCIRQKCTDLKVVKKADMGLKVLRLLHPPVESESMLNFVKPTVVLECQRWKVPYVEHDGCPAEDQPIYHILAPKPIADVIFPGLYIVGVIMELDIGIIWLDSVDCLHPSFHTWTKNEWVREHNKPEKPSLHQVLKWAEDYALCEDEGEDHFPDPEDPLLQRAIW